MELMEAVDCWIPLPKHDYQKPFLMYVSDVYSISGEGTVVTGRIETGTVHYDDQVEILGLGANYSTRVWGIEMNHKTFLRARLEKM